MGYFKELILDLGVPLTLIPLGCRHFPLPSEVSSARNKSRQNEQILGAKCSVEICPSCLSSHPLLRYLSWFAPPPSSCGLGRAIPNVPRDLLGKPCSHGDFCALLQARPEPLKAQCKTRLRHGEQKPGCQNTLVLL